jgi:hypothetical protein
MGISSTAFSQLKESLKDNLSNLSPHNVIKQQLQQLLPHLTFAVFKEIALIVSLCEGVKKSTDNRHLVATLTLYIIPKVPDMCIDVVRTFVEELIGYDQQSGQSFVDLLKQVHTNWNLVIKSSSFKRISSIIGMCTVFSMADKKHLKFTKDGLKKYSNSLLPIHSTSFDFANAIFDTIVHVVERGCAFVTTGDWRVLFVDNAEFRAFDEEFFALVGLSEVAEFGYLEDHGITDDKYADRLEILLETARTFHEKVKGTFEKKLYYERVLKLQKMISDFESKRSHGGLREAPLGIAVTGPSSVGKSTITNFLMSSIMTVHDLGGPEKVITLNEQDKYDSNMRSNIVGVILDDVSNTRPEFVQTAPTNRIISLVNNIVQTAVMAEADKKGKVQLRPKVVVATSNLEDMGARIYSQEPVSIVRRMSIIVRVFVKPEYAVSGSPMLDVDKIPVTEDPFMDLWNFDVVKCVGVTDPTPGSKRPEHVKYVPYTFQGEELTQVNIHKLIEFVLTTFKQHSDRQKYLVKNANNMFDTVAKVLCKQCYCVNCKCLTKQSVFDIQLLEKARRMSQSGCNVLTSVRKQLALTHCFTTLFFKRYEIWDRLRYFLTFFSIFTVLVLLFLRSWHAIYLVPMWFSISFALCDKIEYEYSQLMNNLVFSNQLTLMLDSEYCKYTKRIFLSSTLCYLAYQLSKIWCSVREFTPQGNLAPKTREEIDARDSGVNDWSGVRVSPLPVSQPSKCVTPEQFQSLIEKNLYFAETQGMSQFSVLFIRANVALIPAHMLFDHGVKEEYVVNMIKSKENVNGQRFSARISKTFAYKIPGKDIALCHIPNVPPCKDLTPYFATTMLYRKDCSFIRRNSEGVFDVVPTHISGNNTEGYFYTLPYNTYNGLCGNVLCYTGKAMSILGIHTRGRGGMPHGYASSLFQDEIKQGIKFLQNIPGCCISASEGTFPLSVYDKQILTGTEMHYKSPVYYMPEGSQIIIYGTCEGRATPVSRVERSIISHSVEYVTGVPCQHGPPSFRGIDNKSPWHPWQNTLAKVSQPTIGVEGRLLTLAVQDFSKPLLLLAEDELWSSDIAPLEDLENISGIDGKKFINALSPSTSAGFPLNCPKQNYMEDLPPNEYPTHSCPRKLDDMIMKQFKLMERNALCEERSYPIFKGCLKDEPTRIGKDKVRVFQAASVAHQLVLRKYFLPIARFLSMNPTVAECAVGINAVGPEWHELADYIVYYGNDRILAGDYSKYDLTMSPQLIIAAFDIFIEIAKKCPNYEPVHIKVMENLVTDVAYPLTAYNGDLLQFLGSNPSGQTLTVYINSIVNALLFRCGYFSIIGRDAPPFRQACHLMTYGDDAISSVREGFDAFNHISFASYLKSVDLLFTMPDKESEAVEFMEIANVDFLKRKSIYQPALNLVVGALDEASIFKALHCNVTSAHMSLHEQAADNIDGAILEWFYHGFDIFTIRQIQMRDVANECGIAHMCSNLHKTYDQFVEQWFARYGGN